MPWDAEKIARSFIVYNFLNTFGNNGVSDGGPAVVQQPPPPPAVSEPCTIFTDQSFHAGLRVGPGENRTQRAWLQPNLVVDVTGKKNLDGLIWWQLDKFQAFEQGANSVLELWVDSELVIEQGDCDQVIDVDAPPIIKPPPPQPVETEEPIIEEPTNPDEPYVPPMITLSASDTLLTRGEDCTTIFVNIQYISSAFFDGPGDVEDNTVEGPTWLTDVCPPLSPGIYTYTLDAFDTVGTLHQRNIDIQRS